MAVELETEQKEVYTILQHSNTKSDKEVIGIINQLKSDTSKNILVNKPQFKEIYILILICPLD